jgi:hypothetical protein
MLEAATAGLKPRRCAQNARIPSAFHGELVERATVIDGHADVLGILVDR